MPMFLLPLMVFGGFFVNTNSIPVYFSWIQYLSPMRYGFIAAAKNEFSGLAIDCQPGQNCRAGITGEPRRPHATAGAAPQAAPVGSCRAPAASRPGRHHSAERPLLLPACLQATTS